MGCIGCSCSTGKDSVGGCKSNGGCASGGCNRHNTYDWIAAQGINDPHPFDVVEVSFKNGSRKEFYKNSSQSRAVTGDWVVVESASGGYDVGKISLSGELVRLQMKRKRVRSDVKLTPVVRIAHERDLERLQEVRGWEKNVLVQSRVIARTLDLDMKIGDVEFQGDGRKCTFYYTADGRVDFRELIRHYARDFKVKIEMRQIGARQESARIGGLGNCGRELCCSTWLSEFKSVNTAAARYQNLAINQTKLSGMCGRLKCCLNYELDTYIDALEDFPDKAERIKTNAGLAILVKTDVFKRLMYYTYVDDRSKFYAVHVDQIWEALAMVKNGKLPGSIEDILAMAPVVETDEVEEVEPDFENVQDVIQLPFEKRKKKKKKNKSNRDRSQSAAAAVEKAAEQDVTGNKSVQRDRGNRHRRDNTPPQNNQQRPDNRNQGNPQRPDNKPQGNNNPRQDNKNPNNPQRPDNKPQGNNNPRPENKQQSNLPPSNKPSGDQPNKGQGGGQKKHKFNKNKHKGNGNKPPEQ